MPSIPLPPGSAWAHLWPLDPDIAYLNHGSFGACPASILAAQQRLQARLERAPTRFFMHEMEALLDASRQALAGFVGASPADVVFTGNATEGVNTVLRNLRLQPGDQLLTTSQAYPACRNALEHLARTSGAELVVVPLPFPLTEPQQILTPLLAAATPRTRLLLIDHLTSATALVMPIQDIVPAFAALGIDTLVDGAHAPGQVALDLDALGAAYYAGNCHKWLYTPKGSGFLHVRADRQRDLWPLVISNGASSLRQDRSRFHLLFDWSGTRDYSPALVTGESIRFLAGAVVGGWQSIRQRNHDLAIVARREICELLAVAPPCPDSMLGAMATIPLPDSPNPHPTSDHDPLQRQLFDEHGLETMVIYWPQRPRRVLRISAALYNSPAQFSLLAGCLDQALRRERQG